ncbi:hypothetical protein CAOG_08685 [Capsaspora owczarzaki ATCC 30864]|uniref:hypothetical protein n=1 Tax=Capsaspora owczarzaki (strain ATCC 30864) TaxID=595528 RepID=UPI000352233D|nr:hypothetical protein CAOG_08685 [Capsaspora owczarzaki ATCC 30864]|eukprot:XP_011270296.1 hypothetical protein CAOG_08685 [Capsaspora owczarzaki ATCC 30864]
MRFAALLFAFACCCVAAAAAAAAQPYQPNWQSLDSRPIPDWYDRAKFGIFIHWGVYSVPAWSVVGDYAEWYWERLESDTTGVYQAFHNKTYGPNFKYQDFAAMFKAELFDPDTWADVIARSGAKYVVPTSKHHEGFTNWPSSVSWNWNSVDVGPHRDIIGELFTAFRKRNLHAGMYFSLFEWYNPLYTGPNPEEYVDEIMTPQLHDIINTYQPDLLWTDGEWMQNSSFWKSPDFLAWLFNSSPVKDKIVINDRWGEETRGVHGGFYTAEYSAQVFLNHKWEENSGLDLHSFGYNRMTPAELYLTALDVITLLVRCVCNGGNLLLDIGPSADGRIPELQQERLLEIGAWLDINGEAIYNTSIWTVQQSELVFPFNYSSPAEPRFISRRYADINNFEIPAGTSSDTTVLLGSGVKTYEECQYLCTKNSTCLSFTWYSAAVTNGFALMCYGRIDEAYEPASLVGAFSGRMEFYRVSYTQNVETQLLYAIVLPWPVPRQL